jgi:methylated-DNA-[protein]-cysteine S-methyltransferase
MRSVEAIETPIGPMTVCTDANGLRAIRFDVREPTSGPRTRAHADILAALRAYFRGDLTALDGIPVDPEGGTPFQREVWLMLRGIPAGSTWSYQELARRVGRPSAVRAVGAANGANPVPLVLPCHRVIGANGRLVGYGGGLDRKRWLLGHEGVTSLPLL